MAGAWIDSGMDHSVGGMFRLALAVLLTAYVECGLNCPSDWIYSSRLHRCYQVPIQPLSWDEAVSHCSSVGGHLANIHSQEEYGVVRVIVEKENPQFVTWVGLRMENETGEWRWGDGERIEWQQWHQEPRMRTGECAGWRADRGEDGWVSLPCHYHQFLLCEREADGCTPRYLSAPSGQLSLHGYGNDHECFWHIDLAAGCRVRLSFTSIDTEQNEDVIHVHDGNSEEARQIAKLSGRPSSPQVVVSSGNHITIRFASDGETTGGGFRAEYETWRGPARVNLSSLTGTVTSPGWPTGYHDLFYQEYAIEVTPAASVELSVNAFSVGEGDMLVVYDGHRKTIKTIRRLTHTFSDPLPLLLNSNHNKMLLVFSSSRGEGAGFHLSYRAVPREGELVEL